MNEADRLVTVAAATLPTANRPGDAAHPRQVSFRLSPSYGLLTAREAHDWLLQMMREHEEFVVETDEPGEPPLSFWTETVRGVMVE